MALKQDDRWTAHPRLAFALKATIYLAPVVASVVVSYATHRWLQVAYPSMPWIVAVLLSLPIATAALVCGERLMRRLLPLSLLLKLSLLFPDQVPSRLGIALRAASPKRLARRVLSQDPEESSVAEHVLSLAAALNAHDRRTRGHSERVRAVTMLLADELDVTGPDRDKLEWASLLHDLGKLNVAPEILNKQGRPSEDEWEVLRQHPGSGPALAGGLESWLGDWIHAMDQHHERFDGSGYPNGLTGAEIATSGRIVAVSDAFEVMTATRSYKTPMSTQDARQELVACASTHFDPEVVRAFMDVSTADLHRALGPTSWLLSLPFAGAVGQAVQIGGAITGGAIPPALATAAALAFVAAAADPALAAVIDHDPPEIAAVVDASTVSTIPERVASVGSIDTAEPTPRRGQAGQAEVPTALDGERPTPRVTLPGIEVPSTTIPPGGVLNNPVVGRTAGALDDTLGTVDAAVGKTLDLVDGVVGDTLGLVDRIAGGALNGQVGETLGRVEEAVDRTTDLLDKTVGGLLGDNPVGSLLDGLGRPRNDPGTGRPSLFGR